MGYVLLYLSAQRQKITYTVSSRRKYANLAFIMTKFFSKEPIKSNFSSKTPEPSESSSSSIPSLLTVSATEQISSVQSSNLSSPPGQTITSADVDFFHVTNEEFIASIFKNLPEGAFPAVCSKTGDPTTGGWPAQRTDTANLPVTNNNYVLQR